MKILIEMLSYPFLVRALIVGVLVSLCAALLGTSLVLKRYSMIGDGLSHVGFAALACAYPFGFSPLYISIPVCIAAAFFLLQLKDSSKIKGDAATALMCSGALAVGIMVISLTTGMNTDVCNYMFGSILAMSSSDLYLSIVLRNEYGCVQLYVRQYSCHEQQRFISFHCSRYRCSDAVCTVLQPDFRRDI